MIFLISAYGNHSNQLIQTAQFESFCLENNLRYRNLVRKDIKSMIRYEYSSLFDSILRLILRAGRKIKLIRYIDVDDLPDYSEMSKMLQSAKGILLVSGFKMRDASLLEKHHAYITGRYKNKAKSDDLLKLDEFKRTKRHIIGLHIRLGDYRDYAEGRYYYQVSDYIRWVKRFVLEYQIDNPIIAVFSDQKMTSDLFDFDCEVFTSNNSYNVDYELMGLCDYLIGPPSTFTQWASYTYRVPYFHIDDRSLDRIDTKKFKVGFSN